MPSPAEPTPPETPPSTASPDKAPNSSAAARSRPAPSHDCRVSMRSGNYPQYGDRSTSWPAGYPVAPDQGDRERQDPVRGANRSRRIVGREDVGRPRTRGGPSLSVGPGQGMALRFVERNLGPVPEMGTAVPGPTVGELPGHEYLPCSAFATQMPLNRRRHSVTYPKSIHDLEPPYGIEP